jgi:formate dehydrogenase subunit gamma
MKPENKTSSAKVLARPKRVIVLHWFNAICWFLLTATGLGIIRGEAIRIVPGGWSEMMQNLVGGGANLVLIHSVAGLLWCGVILLFALLNWNSVALPFLKGVITLTPRKVMADFWEIIVFIARLFGRLKQVSLPKEGRYNGAQRLLSTMILACSAVIVVSGSAMFFSAELALSAGLFRWALVAHAFCVGLVWFGLVAHVYFAMVEEPESMEGMKSGYLNAEFIQHHSPAWYAELKQQGKL